MEWCFHWMRLWSILSGLIYGFPPEILRRSRYVYLLRLSSRMIQLLLLQHTLKLGVFLQYLTIILCSLDLFLDCNLALIVQYFRLLWTYLTISLLNLLLFWVVFYCWECSCSPEQTCIRIDVNYFGWGLLIFFCRFQWWLLNYWINFLFESQSSAIGKGWGSYLSQWRGRHFLKLK